MCACTHLCLRIGLQFHDLIPPARSGTWILSRNNRVRGPLQMELEDQVQISGSFEDLCDQNVMIYVMRVKAAEYMPGVLPPSLQRPSVCRCSSPVQCICMAMSMIIGQSVKLHSHQTRRRCWRTDGFA